MLDIVLPDSLYTDFKLSLNGTVYTMGLTYNSRDRTCRLSLTYQGVVVFYPEAIKPDTFLFESQDENVLGGSLYCHPLTDSSVITRDNLFTEFTIRFYTLEELET